METTVSNNSKWIEENSEEIGKIGDFDQRIESNKGNITAIAANITVNSDDIATIRDNIAQVGDFLEANKKQIEENAANIESHSGNITLNTDNLRVSFVDEFNCKLQYLNEISYLGFGNYCWIQQR